MVASEGVILGLVNSWLLRIGECLIDQQISNPFDGTALSEYNITIYASLTYP